MGESDYYTLVAKILVYLYRKYKRERIDENYILPRTWDFPVSVEQLIDTLVMMREQGFVKDGFVEGLGGVIAYMEFEKLKITPAGIDYLQNNPTIKKACRGLKEAKSIASFFA